jgi:hypothetical protein
VYLLFLLVCFFGCGVVWVGFWGLLVVVVDVVGL